MPINESGYNADVVNSFVQGNVTVGTSAVEAKIGSERLAGRQFLRLYNGSNSIVYFGPSGVTVGTGEPLFKNQTITIPLSDANGLYLIASGAGNNILVSEWS